MKACGQIWTRIASCCHDEVLGGSRRACSTTANAAHIVRGEIKIIVGTCITAVAYNVLTARHAVAIRCAVISVCAKVSTIGKAHLKVVRCLDFRWVRKINSYRRSEVLPCADFICISALASMATNCLKVAQRCGRSVCDCPLKLTTVSWRETKRACDG